MDPAQRAYIRQSLPGPIALLDQLLFSVDDYRQPADFEKGDCPFEDRGTVPFFEAGQQLLSQFGCLRATDHAVDPLLPELLERGGAVGHWVDLYILRADGIHDVAAPIRLRLNQQQILLPPAQEVLELVQQTVQ